MKPWQDKGFHTQMIDVDKIDVPEGRRPVDPAAVKALADSIDRVGLITPIAIRHLMDVPSEDDGTPDSMQLIYGAHRLAAHKLLGRTSILCRFYNGEDITEREARKLEITENLHRADLSSLQRSEQVAEWIRLVDSDEEEKPTQVVSVSKGGRGNEGGIRAAAKELGVNREDARRATKVDSIAPEAKAAIVEAGLDDNRSAMLDVARQPAAEQTKRVAEIVEAKKAPRKPDREQIADHGFLYSQEERLFSLLEQHWLGASAETRRKFSERRKEEILDLLEVEAPRAPEDILEFFKESAHYALKEHYPDEDCVIEGNDDRGKLEELQANIIAAQLKSKDFNLPDISSGLEYFAREWVEQRMKAVNSAEIEWVKKRIIENVLPEHWKGFRTAFTKGAVRRMVNYYSLHREPDPLAALALMDNRQAIYIRGRIDETSNPEFPLAKHVGDLDLATAIDEDVEKAGSKWLEERIVAWGKREAEKERAEKAAKENFRPISTIQSQLAAANLGARAILDHAEKAKQKDFQKWKRDEDEAIATVLPTGPEGVKK